MAVELWRELRTKDKSPEVNKEDKAEIQSVAGRTGIAVGWVLGATLGVYLFGFLVAITLFILAYLKQKGWNWKVSIATAVITTALTYGTFQFALPKSTA